MTNVPLSKKGHALLKKRASAKVAEAIVREGRQFSLTGQIVVKIAGKTLRIRSAKSA